LLGLGFVSVMMIPEQHLPQQAPQAQAMTEPPTPMCAPLCHALQSTGRVPKKKRRPSEGVNQIAARIVAESTEERPKPKSG
jgi:hypothetical protein